MKNVSQIALLCFEQCDEKYLAELADRIRGQQVQVISIFSATDTIVDVNHDNNKIDIDCDIVTRELQKLQQQYPDLVLACVAWHNAPRLSFDILQDFDIMSSEAVNYEYYDDVAAEATAHLIASARQMSMQVCWLIDTDKHAVFVDKIACSKIDAIAKDLYMLFAKSEHQMNEALTITNDAAERNKIALPYDLGAFEVLNQLRDITFDIANKTHRYDSKPSIADVLMHTIGEANEAHVAMAGDRHAKQEDVDLLLDLLKKGDYSMFKKYFKFAVKSTFEDEMADLLLMVLSIAGYYNVDLATHAMMKCKYNELRAEHSAVSDYENNKQH